jgi:hypothetical protein
MMIGWKNREGQQGKHVSRGYFAVDGSEAFFPGAAFTLTFVLAAALTLAHRFL